MTRKGWFREPARHSLAARGMRTALGKPRHAPYKFAKEPKAIIWESKDFGAKLAISSKLVGEGVKAPFDEDDPRTAHFLRNKFKITVTNLDNKKKTSFDWYGSYKDYRDGVTKMSDHDTLYAVLTWLEDAYSAASQTFEGWAKEFGYDEDSRKAEYIYKELKKSAKKVENLLGRGYTPDTWGMMAQEIRHDIGE